MLENTAAYRSNTMTICTAFEKCLAPSFGPAGSDAAIVEPSSAIVVTKSGNSILNSLKVSHPVATFIQKSVAQFAERNGDGTISFCILLCTSIRLAFKSLQPGSWGPQTNHVQLHRLVSAFEYIRHNFATYVSAPLRQCVCSIDDIQGHNQTLACETGVELHVIFRKIRLLAVTFLSSSFNIETAAALADIFLSWITKHHVVHGKNATRSEPDSVVRKDLAWLLRRLHASASSLVVFSAGKQLEHSHVADYENVFLSSDFDPTSQSLMETKHRLQGARFLIFSCPLRFTVDDNSCDDTDEEDVFAESPARTIQASDQHEVFVQTRQAPETKYHADIQSKDSYSGFLRRDSDLASQLVDLSVANGVNLIFSTSSASAAVVQALSARNISLVTHLSKADAELLRSRSGAHILTSIPLPTSRVRIGSASLVTSQVSDSTGNRRSLVVQGIPTPSSCSSDRGLRQLVLCSQSNGLCEQYYTLLLRLLRSLSVAIDGTDPSLRGLSVVPGAGAVELHFYGHFRRLAESSKASADCASVDSSSQQQLNANCSILPGLPTAWHILSQACLSIVRTLIDSSMTMISGNHSSRHRPYSILRTVNELERLCEAGSERVGLVLPVMQMSQSGMTGQYFIPEFVKGPPHRAGVVEPLAAKENLFRYVLDAIITLLRTQQVLRVSRTERKSTPVGDNVARSTAAS